MCCVSVIQEIINTGLAQYRASKEEAKVILEGDQPWTRRVIRVSICPRMGSMFNEGIWSTQGKTWEGTAIPRTMHGDEAQYMAFRLGMPSLEDAGCSMQQNLRLPFVWVLFYILQSTMAMGSLFGEFVDRQVGAITPSLRQDLQVLLSERHAGWSVYTVLAHWPPC